MISYKQVKDLKLIGIHYHRPFHMSENLFRMSIVSTHKVEFLTFSISKEMNNGYMKDHIKELTTTYGSIEMLSQLICNKLMMKIGRL